MASSPEAAKLKKKRWALVYPNYELRTIGGRDFQETGLSCAALLAVRCRASGHASLATRTAGAVTQVIADAKARCYFQRAVRRRSRHVSCVRAIRSQFDSAGTGQSVVSLTAVGADYPRSAGCRSCRLRLDRNELPVVFDLWRIRALEHPGGGLAVPDEGVAAELQAVVGGEVDQRVALVEGEPPFGRLGRVPLQGVAGGDALVVLVDQFGVLAERGPR